MSYVVHVGKAKLDIEVDWQALGKFVLAKAKDNKSNATSALKGAIKARIRK